MMVLVAAHPADETFSWISLQLSLDAQSCALMDVRQATTKRHRAHRRPRAFGACFSRGNKVVYV